MRRKKVKKEEKEIIEDVIVKDEDVGEVLPITADKDNPIGDGREFAEGEEDE